MTDNHRSSQTSTAWQRHRAARTLAHHALDADDLAELLDMVGLTAAEGLVPAVEQPEPETGVPPTKLDEGTGERLSQLLRLAAPAGHRRVS